MEQINQSTTQVSQQQSLHKAENYNVNMELNKELIDNTYSMIKDVVTQGIDKSIEKLASNTGAGAAAGTAAAAVLKSNLAPVQKIVMTGAAAGITAATTKLGMDFSSAMIKNRIENDKILNKMDPDRIPSPDNTFICSLIEKIENVTPLEQLIQIQLLINIILIISIFLFVLLLFNKLFWSSFSSPLGALDLALQQGQGEQNKIKLYLNKLRIFTQNYFYMIFIILTIQVLILLFFNIIISSELTINLEDYIRVYNHIKGKG